MKFKDIVSAILIILVFVAMYFASFMAIGIRKLKKDWPKYRCNPMAMPLAGSLGHNTMQNFVFCIGSIQKGLMGHFLEPVYYAVELVGNLGGIIGKAINKIRAVIFGLKRQIMEIVGDIFGTIMNVIIQFQKMIIKLKDLIMKLIGVMTTTMFMVQGVSHTGNSLWRGPIGKTLQTLCFSPKTKIKMKNGKLKEMKDIEIGDKLHKGNKVIATLKIKGDQYSPYYKIFSKDLNENILVTGEHLIQDPQTNKFIPVSKCKIAELTEIRDKELSCLITSDNLIHVGEYTFWDWED